MKLALSAAALILLGGQAEAQDGEESEDGGKIVMYRQGSIMGAALGCPIRYRGEELVELGRNKFAEWEVPPGSYILSNKTSSIEVNVFPGQTKFVRCVIKSGMLSGRADLQIVDEETFQKNSDDFERKDVAIPAE